MLSDRSGDYCSQLSVIKKLCLRTDHKSDGEVATRSEVDLWAGAGGSPAGRGRGQGTSHHGHSTPLDVLLQIHAIWASCTIYIELDILLILW